MKMQQGIRTLKKVQCCDDRLCTLCLVTLGPRTPENLLAVVSQPLKLKDKFRLIFVLQL